VGSPPAVIWQAITFHVNDAARQSVGQSVSLDHEPIGHSHRGSTRNHKPPVRIHDGQVLELREVPPEDETDWLRQMLPMKGSQDRLSPQARPILAAAALTQEKCNQ
jgi:hypothetical protein